ncbi:MAG: hypothetical protein AAGG46_05850 [Planctomycetota bacterium]
MLTLLQVLTLTVVAFYAVFLGWKSTRHFVLEARRTRRTGEATDGTSSIVTKEVAPTIYWPTLIGLLAWAATCSAIATAVAVGAVVAAGALLGGGGL